MCSPDLRRDVESADPQRCLRTLVPCEHEQVGAEAVEVERHPAHDLRRIDEREGSVLVRQRDDAFDREDRAGDVARGGHGNEPDRAVLQLPLERVERNGLGLRWGNDDDLDPTLRKLLHWPVECVVLEPAHHDAVARLPGVIGDCDRQSGSRAPSPQQASRVRDAEGPADLGVLRLETFVPALGRGGQRFGDGRGDGLGFGPAGSRLVRVDHDRHGASAGHRDLTPIQTAGIQRARLRQALVRPPAHAASTHQSVIEGVAAGRHSAGPFLVRPDSQGLRRGIRHWEFASRGDS
jgi:hypothetical protein